MSKHHLTVCSRCAIYRYSDATCLTGFRINESNQRCDTCGNVAADLGMIAAEELEQEEKEMKS